MSNACGFHCIKIKDMSVTIADEVILEQVNVHIHCGNLTAIIGKNGAGKSTLLRAILGEIPHTGIIELKDIQSGTIKKLKIGYVPQHINIQKNTPTSVYDLFASYISSIPVCLKRSKKVYAFIQKQLKLFQAEGLIEKAVCDLSGGELQRVLLSIATTPTPNLLILDEPVSGIDQNGMELFYQTIDRLKKEYDLAIILVSHDLNYVEKYADEVILLDKTILEYGTPKIVFQSKKFLDVFGMLQQREE